MIKLEINFSGASPDETRRLESLLTQIANVLAGGEKTSPSEQTIDPYASTKRKILHLMAQSRIRRGTWLTTDFWHGHIKDDLNPKDKQYLMESLISLCDEGFLSQIDEDDGDWPWGFQLTEKGFNKIY